MLPAAVLLRLPLRRTLDLRLTLAFFFRVPERDGVVSLYAAVEALEAERFRFPLSRSVTGRSWAALVSEGGFATKDRMAYLGRSRVATHCRNPCSGACRTVAAQSHKSHSVAFADTKSWLPFRYREIQCVAGRSTTKKSKVVGIRGERSLMSDRLRRYYKIRLT